MLKVSIIHAVLCLFSIIQLIQGTEDKCRNDCSLPINLTHAEWSMYEAGPRYISTHGIYLFICLYQLIKKLKNK